MKNIIRTILLTVLIVAVFKGVSTGQWSSSITIVIVSGVLLLVTFISAKSSRGSSAYTGNDSTASSSSNSSHSYTDCGGDSGGGCD
ncbi:MULTISPECIES: hypothetical protein [Pseudoalteromonas]|jgi:cytoskeletal protein RodZ|uniref:Uncharacterized protein n=1 Tax=Pseudoalteromonas distincta TaxID=77608 RepID=A0A4P9J749_9GAMM|nr:MULTISPECIES: hypothetical protein [Pseudoalteromonas]KAA1154221.1 hypothetical protein EU511_18120 [Pseudoalteromonas distincta]QCU76594.1 hypothetical protein FFU37_19260 [Pseudoalteromonas distincta]QQM65901.1 hypothetical protein JG479_18410 [Pseudoalteromonas sp. LC2018020214]|tara:strand:- start:29544 stop:29801 length:258 start_codon:yes stop_codon:yes gene_type:complete